MSLSQPMPWLKTISLAQGDRIIATLVAACLLPLCLHALPFPGVAGTGARWLPIFYAPLIAAFCFRPHVTLVVSLCAPLISHSLFGMPDNQVWPLLTVELLVFNSLLLLVRRRGTISGWHIILAYLVALFLGLLLGAHLTLQQLGDQLLASVRISTPGILTLAIIAETVVRIQKR